MSHAVTGVEAQARHLKTPTPQDPATVERPVGGKETRYSPLTASFCSFMMLPTSSSRLSAFSALDLLRSDALALPTSKQVS